MHAIRRSTTLPNIIKILLGMWEFQVRGVHVVPIKHIKESQLQKGKSGCFQSCTSLFIKYNFYQILSKISTHREVIERTRMSTEDRLIAISPNWPGNKIYRIVAS